MRRRPYLLPGTEGELRMRFGGRLAGSVSDGHSVSGDDGGDGDAFLFPFLSAADSTVRSEGTKGVGLEELLCLAISAQIWLFLDPEIEMEQHIAAARLRDVSMPMIQDHRMSLPRRGGAGVARGRIELTFASKRHYFFPFRH